MVFASSKLIFLKVWVPTYLYQRPLRCVLKSALLPLPQTFVDKAWMCSQASTWINLSFSVSCFASLETGPYFLRVDLTPSIMPFDLLFVHCVQASLALSTLPWHLFFSKAGQTQLLSWLQPAALLVDNWATVGQPIPQYTWQKWVLRSSLQPSDS